MASNPADRCAFEAAGCARRRRVEKYLAAFSVASRSIKHTNLESRMKLSTAVVLTVGIFGLSIQACRAAPTYGVNVTGYANTSALNVYFGQPTVGGGASQASSLQTGGYLAQTSYAAATAAAARGTETTRLGGDLVVLPQAADASIATTATIGALHGVAGADASISGSLDATGSTRADALINMSWADTVTFTSNDPLGTDFDLALTLDDSLSTSFGEDGRFYGDLSAASASARIVLQTSLTDTTSMGAGLLVQDSLSQAAGGVLTQGSPAQRTVTEVLHVVGTETLAIVGSMYLTADVNGVTGTAGADARDTALFQLSTTDPAAFYTTASGAVFATGPETIAPAVPEPSEWALLLVGIGAGGCIVRRRGLRR